MKTLALTVGIVGLTAVAMAAMQAQAPSAAPAFEVVSVKPSAPNPSSPLGMIPMVLPAGNGRFTATNVPLRLLVRMAYGLQDFQIEGGPSWQLSQRFDIVAKAADGFAGGQQAMMPMVKTDARRLLGWPDRFTVLQLGRLVPRKGIDNVIRAIACLKTEHHVLAMADFIPPIALSFLKTPVPAASLNWMLEQPLRAEAALLRSGRRIPAGLSLVGIFEAS